MRLESPRELAEKQADMRLYPKAREEIVGNHLPVRREDLVASANYDIVDRDVTKNIGKRTGPRSQGLIHLDS